MRKADTALVIAGHGSTENPDSSAPSHRHADEIRSRGIFDEVACAFWKEEPSFRQVYRMLESPNIYVVPNFISEGYFTREVIPRELRLDPDSKLSNVDGRRVRYCDPVGIHPHMTGLILKRAAEVAPDAPPAETTLLVVGHGTKLNPDSRIAIEQQVERIRQGGATRYAAVGDAYMEEAPFISDWDTLVRTPCVIVVPFFISDGLHSYQDIPVLLGIEGAPTAAASQNDVFRRNPYCLRGRELCYAAAIGTDPAMAEIILDQVRDLDLRFCQDSSPTGS